MHGVLGLIIWLAIYCGIGYGVYSFWSASNRQSITSISVPPEVEWNIRVVTAEPQDHSIYRQLRGTVSYVDTYELSFSRSGCLDYVKPSLTEGSAVTEGEVLASLDTSAAELNLQEAEQANALLQARLKESTTQVNVSRSRQKRAEREVEIAERQLARQRDLFANKLLSQSAMDQLEQGQLEIQNRALAAAEDVMIAKGNLETLEAERAQADIAIRAAAVVLADMTLRAPQDGIVTQDNLTGATCVAAYAPLLTTSDPSDKVVNVAMSYLVISELSKSGQLQGKAVQFLPPYAGCQGIADRLSTQTSQANGAILRIRLDAECAAQMNENVILPLRIRSQVLPGTIRLPAVVEWDAGHVFVVEEDQLRTRAVSIVARDENWLYVNDGLMAGDLVLTSRPDFAIEGQRVRVIEE